MVTTICSVTLPSSRFQTNILVRVRMRVVAVVLVVIMVMVVVIVVLMVVVIIRILAGLVHLASKIQSPHKYHTDHNERYDDDDVMSTAALAKIFYLFISKMRSKV